MGEDDFSRPACTGAVGCPISRRTAARGEVNLAALIYLSAEGAISSDREKTIFRTRGFGTHNQRGHELHVARHRRLRRQAGRGIQKPAPNVICCLLCPRTCTPTLYGCPSAAFQTISVRVETAAGALAPFNASESADCIPPYN
jgi:hypothetical protein